MAQEMAKGDQLMKQNWLSHKVWGGRLVPGGADPLQLQGILHFWRETGPHFIKVPTAGTLKWLPSFPGKTGKLNGSL